MTKKKRIDTEGRIFNEPFTRETNTSVTFNELLMKALVMQQFLFIFSDTA